MYKNLNLELAMVEQHVFNGHLKQQSDF